MPYDISMDRPNGLYACTTDAGGLNLSRKYQRVTCSDHAHYLTGSIRYFSQRFRDRSVLDVIPARSG